MRRIVRNAALLSGLLGGCTAINGGLQPPDRPGVYVRDEAAARWGCRGDYVRVAAGEFAKTLPAGHVYTPQVGWTACELLARVGEPREVDLQQSQFGRSASLWYGSPQDPHLVRLVQDGARWRVDYVGW